MTADRGRVVRADDQPTVRVGVVAIPATESPRTPASAGPACAAARGAPRVARRAGDGTRPRAVARIAAWLALAGLLVAGPAGAQELTLTRMNHAAWTAQDGAPQGITRLAQAPDGTLWIGTEGGLYHFDGRTFTLHQSPDGQPEMPAEPVRSLLVTGDGTVWAGYYRSGVVRIARGRVTRFDRVAGRQVKLVLDLREARDGSVWAHGDHAVIMRFPRGDSVWHQDAEPPGAAHDRIDGLYIDRADVLWLARSGRMFTRQLPGHTYTPTGGGANTVLEFAETPAGDVWIAEIDVRKDRPYLRRFDRQGRPLATLTLPHNAPSLLHTPDGSLFVSMVGRARKLYQYDADALAGLTRLPYGPGIESYSGVVGATDAAPTALLQDAAGNLWVGGRRGLGRFRAPRLAPFVANSTQKEGDLCATPEGDVYVAAGRDGLFRVTERVTRRVPDSGGILAVFCGADGVVRAWKPGLLYELRGGVLQPLPSLRSGAPAVALRRLVALPDHTLYAFRGLGLGVWRYKDGEWTELTAPGVEHADAGPYVDTRGRLWVGYDRGRVGLPLEGRAFSSGTPGLHYVTAILETSHGHFAAGTNGLAVLRDTSFQLLRFADRASTSGVSGLVESKNGDLYLNAIRGIVRVPAVELAAGLSDPRYPMRTERITEGNFTGPARLSGTWSTAARAADGTLWFSMLSGVVSYDPDAARAASGPPVLSIRSITADRVPLGARRTFDPQPRALAIQYFGVHLTAPDRVRYRYKLDGFDDAWQDAGSRTEAMYTRPGPGTYTFRVMAANEAGVWTAPVASAPFTVLPSFYQTRWFAALAAVSVVALAWAAYTLRVRAVTALVRARTEERADERVRIARELHDTLLSGMAGIMTGLGAAARRARAPGALDPEALDTLYTQTRRMLVEAREAVVAMRTSTDALSPLTARLDEAADRIFRGTGAEVRVASSGTPRPLPPEVDAQVVRVVVEAMANARAHAACGAVEVACAYGPRELTVRVRDDGHGFDPAVAGANGHYGLRGMRERAAAIGARLTVESAPGQGTTVRLEVPARPTA